MRSKQRIQELHRWLKPNWHRRHFQPGQPTSDHKIEPQQGGESLPRGARTPDQAVMKLLGVPYAPGRAAYLLLIASGFHVIADQQAWLESFA